MAGLHHVRIAAYVHAQASLPISRSRIKTFGDKTDGAIYQIVQAAPAGTDSAYTVLARLRIGNVYSKEFNVMALGLQGFSPLLSQCPVDVKDGNGGIFFGEFAHRCRADSRCAPGHDGNSF